MAYSPPPQWVPNSASVVPTATLMNLYDQDLDEIYARLGDYAVNYAVRKLDGENFHVIVHRHQWLHFRGNDGYLEPTTGTDAEIAAARISLSAEDFSVYNLDTIDWMVPGTIYRVRGVDMASENATP